MTHGTQIEPSEKMLFHPFKCRLNDTADFETSSGACMTPLGFSCWSIGMLTIFRPSFILLISIIDRKHASASREYFRLVVYFWFTLVLFVFFVLGWIPMFATKIKKRWVLLIHPWALLLLYFDVFVWLTVTIKLHVEMFAGVPFVEDPLKNVKISTAFFVIIYIDVIIYSIIYYVYGTYYIVAELTIIEKFY